VRGAHATLSQSAGLGLLDQMKGQMVRTPSPTHTEISDALWSACHGGQQVAAELLVAQGAHVNWIGHGDHAFGRGPQRRARVDCGMACPARAVRRIVQLRAVGASSDENSPPDKVTASRTICTV
jgi:hypothetical protein